MLIPFLIVGILLIVAGVAIFISPGPFTTLFRGFTRPAIGERASNRLYSDRGGRIAGVFATLVGIGVIVLVIVHPGK